MSPRPSPSAFAWSVWTMYWHCLVSTLAFSPSERKGLKIFHQASPTYHVSTFRLPDRYMRSSHCVYMEAIKDREEAGEGLGTKDQSCCPSLVRNNSILDIVWGYTDPVLWNHSCERVSSTSQMKMVHKDVGAVKEVGNAIMRLYPGFMQTELEPLSPSLPFQTVFLQWNCLLGLPLGGGGR